MTEWTLIPWRPLAGCAAMLAVAGLGNLSAAEPLFEQNFDNEGDGNLPVDVLGWQAYRGANALDVSSMADNPEGSVGIGSGAGNPRKPTGYLFVTEAREQESQSQPFAVVHVFAKGLKLEPGDVFSWRMGNTAESGLVRLLIQVQGDGSVDSGTWYASAAGFSDKGGYSRDSFAAASASQVTNTFTFTMEAAAWRAFTLHPDSELAIGTPAPVDVFSDTITGVGFYVVPSFAQQSVRIDSFRIDSKKP